MFSVTFNPVGGATQPPAPSPESDNETQSTPPVEDTSDTGGSGAAASDSDTAAGGGTSGSNSGDGQAGASNSPAQTSGTTAQTEARVAAAVLDAQNLDDAPVAQPLNVADLQIEFPVQSEEAQMRAQAEAARQSAVDAAVLSQIGQARAVAEEAVTVDASADADQDVAVEAPEPAQVVNARFADTAALLATPPAGAAALDRSA